MAITNRIKRLFRADMNAILDIIEEPDVVLKQAIREMQETLDRDRGLLARCRKILEGLQQNETFLNEELGKTKEDLRLCLREGAEELVRKTIGRKLSLEKHLKAVERKISRLERLNDEKVHQIEHQQNQLDSITEKAAFYVGPIAEDSPFSVADSILSFSEQGISSSNTHVTQEEIDLEWIRIQEEGGDL